MIMVFVFVCMCVWTCLCVSFRKSVVPALFVLCPLLREPTAVCVISIQVSSPVTGCQASEISHQPHTRPLTCLLKLKALASVTLLTRLSTAEGQIDIILQVMVKKKKKRKKRKEKSNMSQYLVFFSNQYQNKMLTRRT